jgi:hypothetical protein
LTIAARAAEREDRMWMHEEDAVTTREDGLPRPGLLTSLSSLLE